MIKSMILIDNKYFVSADPDLIVSLNVHDAKILEGFINIKSCMDKILQCILYSDFCFEEISILNL